MGYLSAYHTDVGIKKKTNQDSLYIAEANTVRGPVLLAVICDGMGGLSEGELASAVLCREFSKWFRQYLPVLLKQGWNPESLKTSWENMLAGANEEILDYSGRKHLAIGTTVVALLLIENSYCCINIGDSRLYKISDALYQITKDQTVVQREVDMGLLTAAQAERDPRRNVLLQCIGASAIIEPQFVHGSFDAQTVFLLCSDGYRHVVTPQEIYDNLNPAKMRSEQEMVSNLALLTELNKYRREDDNISAIAARLAL
ncbi:MAG: serine/threonine-protein phosphatase [Coriobacteriales bacterium]|jgi:serine/threonine protein phosphatase PrpC|nr:serine/threonine-protein phosphatase [Coriobacteriales bacterium]